MTGEFVPDKVITADGAITLNEGRETAEVTVGNAGDQPIQVDSHFRLFEANAALSFDREAAYGMRLNIPAGTMVRSEPDDQASVELVAIGDERRVHGMNGMVNGSADTGLSAAVGHLRAIGFVDTGVPDDEHGTVEGLNE